MCLDKLDEDAILQIFKEVKILEVFSHPFIISIEESYRTESNKLVLILEYADKGDLKMIIDQ